MMQKIIRIMQYCHFDPPIAVLGAKYIFETFESYFF